MSYLQTNFQGASIPSTDARQTKMFIQNMQDREKQRADKSKALAEDQKKLSMIAQGFGLQKGEADSMSRGELSGFIENNINDFNQQKQRGEQAIALGQSMNAQRNTETQAQMANAQNMFAQANMQQVGNQMKLLKQQQESDLDRP